VILTEKEKEKFKVLFYQMMINDNDYLVLNKKYFSEEEKTVFNICSDKNMTIGDLKDTIKCNNSPRNPRKLKYEIINLDTGAYEPDEIKFDDNKSLLITSKSDTENIIYEIISSVDDYIKKIKTLQNDECEIFFRGHTNANYSLQPSVFRNNNWKRNESELYHELLLNCPEDFYNCKKHIVILVKMQHYQLPTRMLDITSNALMGLYFASEYDDTISGGNDDLMGEVIIIKAKKEVIKYDNSDTATIFASLPSLDYASKCELFVLANDFHKYKQDKTLKNFNDKAPVKKLLNEIKTEKPGFRERIIASDLLKNVVIKPSKDNRRIRAQSGAFFLCGLNGSFFEEEIRNAKHSLNINSTVATKDFSRDLDVYRYSEGSAKLVLLVKNKKEIRNELIRLGIDKKTVYPEIDNVAKYIKDLYK